MLATPILYLRRYSFFVYGVAGLRVRFPGMSATSWGRSPAHNAAVGGKDDSQHKDWTAVDVVWDPGTQPDLEVLRAAARPLGLEVDREVDHDHIEVLPQFE